MAYATPITASVQDPLFVNGSGAGTVVVAAPGASLFLVIRKGSVHNYSTSENTCVLREGAAGTSRWSGNLAADGGGSLFDFGPNGWKLPAATALVADIGAASVDVNVTDYSIVGI